MNPTARRNSAVSNVFESLERRTHLYGNVTATLAGGDLTLQGDSGDNHVVVSRNSNGTTRIAGRDGTKVNGKTSVSLGKITDDFVAKMLQGGTDLVAVQGQLNIPGDVTSNIGAGEFLLEGSSGPINIGGNLTINAGEEGLVSVRNEINVSGEVSIDSAGEANVVSAAATVPNLSAARFSNSLNINNPYFPLVAGSVYKYDVAGVDDETGEAFTERIVVEVTNQTKLIEGVRTRVVLDRVYSEGLLIESTFDWYAQDDNGNVWYFGEDTTAFEYDDEGNLIGTETGGSWISGVDGAQAGTIMEAKPRVGHRYYQEFAPGDVLDIGVGVSTRNRVKVPVGKYLNVFRSEETTVTEPNVLANKLYAPGVGAVVEFDYDLEDTEVVQTTRLVSLTLNGKAVKTVVSPTRSGGTNPDGRFVGAADFTGDAEIGAAGPVVINSANFDGTLDIDTEEEAFIVNADLTGNVNIVADEAVSLRNIFAEGTVRVGGKSDVFVFDSFITRLNGRFGGADNDLTIAGTMIDMLDADGGTGENTFYDNAGNSFGSTKFRNFEQA